MKTIKVLISVTYSKSCELEVDDNFSEEELRDEAKKQWPLPKGLIEPLAEVARVKPDTVYPNYKPEVFEGWLEDDYEVIIDN